MGKRFFKPYVGEDYEKGFLDSKKKVLVLGASHYCTIRECTFWEKCTSLELRDSSAYNEICPPYKKQNDRQKLEDSASIEIENYLGGGNYLTYDNFTKALVDSFGKDIQYIWNQLAFVNYVQFFLPFTNTPIQTQKDIINFESFIENVDELKPDIVIIWGTKVTNHFKRKYVKMMANRLEVQSDDYFWKMEIKKHQIIIVNPYHPSNVGNWWKANVENFIKAFKKALYSSYTEL